MIKGGIRDTNTHVTRWPSRPINNVLLTRANTEMKKDYFSFFKKNLRVFRPVLDECLHIVQSCILPGISMSQEVS